jgi:hypothetical protein
MLTHNRTWMKLFHIFLALTFVPGLITSSAVKALVR